MNKRSATLFAILSLVLVSLADLSAQDSADDMAGAAANPLANIINFPLQNNANFGIGPYDRTANVLNIQPVVPLMGGSLITRTIFPIVWIPDVASDEGMLSTGLGDVLFTGWWVPKSGSLTLGIGPAVSIPTGGNVRGIDMWGLGPSVVILAQPAPWTVGGLFNTIWSVGADSTQASSTTGLFQYFVTRQLGGGWYVNTAPIITIDWKAEEDKFVVPFGLGAGKVVFVGKLPLNLQTGVYYNAVKPEGSADWQLRVQVQAMLPMSMFGGG
jgi:hypothetical protein